MMDSKEALEYIHNLNRFGIKLGLDNIRRLLDLLGNPQDKLEYIHIAGTNGKGSVASYIAHGLMAAGYQVGRFVSPYLEKFNERIQIDEQLISNEDLARITTKIKAIIQEQKDDFQPTEFEVVTAIGFCYFAEKAVDIVVLEVGMGGRFDSTNVIRPPLVTVITPISFDHQQYLGDTIEEIAGEKAGIIKTGSRVVTVQPDSKALDVIEDVCDHLGVSLKAIEVMPSEIRYHLDNTSFVYLGQAYKIQLLGSYQPLNAVLAIEALNLLSKTSRFQISQQSMDAGLFASRWPGRFEKLADKPLTIIDGAHNLAGIAALRDSLDVYFKDKYKIAVFGIMADKDVEKIVELVAKDFDEFYLVTPNNPRALAANQLAKVIKKYNKNATLFILDDLTLLKELKNRNREQDILLIGFGSLYLVGDLRQLWKED